MWRIFRGSEKEEEIKKAFGLSRCVFILIFLSHKKMPSQYWTFYRLEITPCFDFVKHCGINLFPFCPSQAQNLETDGPPLWYFIPKFLQNSAWKWLNEVIKSKSCKLAGISRRNITLHSWLAFPYSPSSSPIISDVGDTLKVYKHCAVLEKKKTWMWKLKLWLQHFVALLSWWVIFLLLLSIS